MAKKFLSGNEAFAYGVRLARPDVISAYPITPQTTVVEKLADFVEDGSLDSEFLYVESEHSALSAAIGASATGVRTFTATSSQGLLYMAECLTYAAGGRFPIVMMNANRSTALPWNIYGDQRDSVSLLDHGWIQAYAADAQEALDLALLAYAIAEKKEISTPFMVNLDGFVLTHTYEVVDIPKEDEVRRFLPEYTTDNRFDFDASKNMCFSAGPEYNTEFKIKEHKALLKVREAVSEAEERFFDITGRRYTGLTEEYRTQDADYVLITLGSIGSLAKEAVDELRNAGKRAGTIRLRYLRPFPDKEICRALRSAKAVGVLEKDISFGYEGTVYTNVNSALHNADINIASVGFTKGLGGRDISKEEVLDMFKDIEKQIGGR